MAHRHLDIIPLHLPLVEMVVSTYGDEVLEARLPQQLSVHQLMHHLSLQRVFR